MENSPPVKELLGSIPPYLQEFVSSLCLDLQLEVVDDTFITLLGQQVKQRNYIQNPQSGPLCETFCRAVSFLLIREYNLGPTLSLVLDCLAFICSTQSKSSKRAARVFEDLWLEFDDDVSNWALDNSLENTSDAIKNSCLWLLFNHFSIYQGQMDVVPLAQVASFYKDHTDPMLKAAANELLNAVYSECDHRITPPKPPHVAIPALPDSRPQMPISQCQILNPQPQALKLQPQIPQNTFEPPLLEPASEKEMLNLIKVSLAEIKQQPAYGFLSLKLPKSKIASDQELRRMLEQSFKGKESDENWSKRSDLVCILRQRLRTLAKSGSNDDVTLYVQEIIGFVCIAASSLRTTYAISALQFIIEIYLTLPFSCEWLQPIIQREIYPLCLLNKRLVANFASYVIGVMILNSNYNAKLLQFPANVLASTNSQSHVYGPQWTAWILAAHSQRVAVNLDQVASLTESALKDSSNETRQGARRVFWMLSWHSKPLALKIAQQLNTAHRNALIASRSALSV